MSKIGTLVLTAAACVAVFYGNRYTLDREAELDRMRSELEGLIGRETVVQAELGGYERFFEEMEKLRVAPAKSAVDAWNRIQNVFKDQGLMLLSVTQNESKSVLNVRVVSTGYQYDFVQALARLRNLSIPVRVGTVGIRGHNRTAEEWDPDSARRFEYDISLSTILDKSGSGV